MAASAACKKSIARVARNVEPSFRAASSTLKLGVWSPCTAPRASFRTPRKAKQEGTACAVYVHAAKSGGSKMVTESSMGKVWRVIWRRYGEGMEKVWRRYGVKVWGQGMGWDSADPYHIISYHISYIPVKAKSSEAIVKSANSTRWSPNTLLATDLFKYGEHGWHKSVIQEGRDS